MYLGIRFFPLGWFRYKGLDNLKFSRWVKRSGYGVLTPAWTPVPVGWYSPQRSILVWFYFPFSLLFLKGGDFNLTLDPSLDT